MVPHLYREAVGNQRVHQKNRLRDLVKDLHSHLNTNLRAVQNRAVQKLNRKNQKDRHHLALSQNFNSLMNQRKLYQVGK